MTEVINQLFSVRGIPHGYCFSWDPQLLWTMVGANALVAAAYFSIPFALNRFIRLQPGMPFKGIFLLFSGFIFFCGVTHVIDIINVWRPMYQLEGMIMSMTALLSIATAAVMFPLVPKASRFLDEQRAQGARLEALNEELRETTSAMTLQNQQLELSEARFRSTFEGAPIGLAIVGLDGRWLEVNQALCTILDYPAEMLMRMTFGDLTHPDDLQSDLDQVNALIRGDYSRYHMKKRYIARGGREVMATLDVALIRDKAGEPLMFISQIQDITLRSQTEAALRKSELRGRTLAALGESLQSCQQVTEIGPPLADACLALFPGCSGTLYALNNSENWLRSEHTWGNDPVSEPVCAVDDCWSLRRGGPFLVCHDQTNVNRCRHIKPNIGGDECSLCLPMLAQGDVVGMLHLNLQPQGHAENLDHNHAALIETGEQIAGRVAVAMANLNLRESLLYQSIRDPLTNLYNRRHLEESMARDIARAQRDSTQIAVMMMDVDHFKRYNDEYGHASGDFALKTVADVLAAFCRHGDLAGRYGGEEFTVVLTHIDEASALHRAESLRQQIAAAKATMRARTLPPVTVSIGVALYPLHGDTTESLLAAADRALYRAKESGRNTVVSADAFG
jgi:diguanylate cyclase (GGDEF)-like protein/PAS domain S-box-containing protein